MENITSRHRYFSAQAMEKAIELSMQTEFKPGILITHKNALDTIFEILLATSDTVIARIHYPDLSVKGGRTFKFLVKDIINVADFIDAYSKLLKYFLKKQNRDN